MLEVTDESTESLTRITIWPTGKAPTTNRIDVVNAAGRLEIIARLTVPFNMTAPIARVFAIALNMAADIVERRVKRRWPNSVKKVVREFYGGREKNFHVEHRRDTT
jgi:hypothetical protein